MSSAPPRAFVETNPHPHGKSWLDQYVWHQRFTESPRQFHFWTGVATIAGALRRKVWIDMLHFEWTPNMYIILVGPAGVAAKSTTMRGGTSLLAAVEGVHFGPQSTTWQALIEAFKQSQQIIEFKDRPPESMACLTIAIGELGTFFSPENKEMNDMLTALWDGQKEDLRRTTISKGTTVIQNPWLNIIACTTPAWLRDRFPEELVGGGLTSRIVFVYGDRKEQLIAYPADHLPGPEYAQEKQFLIHDLKQIAELKGEYQLDPDAKQWGKDWYDRLNGRTPPAHLASGRFDGYIARKQTHVHKLAMVLAASRRSALRITRDDLQEAERYVTGLEGDMIKVFDSIGVSKQAAIDMEVIKIIKRQRTVTWQALVRNLHGVHDVNVIKVSVQAAIEAGMIKKEHLGGTDYRLTYVKGKDKIDDGKAAAE